MMTPELRAIADQLAITDEYDAWVMLDALTSRQAVALAGKLREDVMQRTAMAGCLILGLRERLGTVAADELLAAAGIGSAAAAMFTAAAELQRRRQH